MRLSLSLFLCVFVACGGESAPVEPPAPAPKVSAPAAPVKVAAAPVKVATGPTGSADIAAGKAVYEKYCMACHQADGTGMGGMLAANLKEDKARLQQDDATLIKSIKEGKTGKIGTMPPWGGTLSDAEVVSVLGYLRATYGGE